MPFLEGDSKLHSCEVRAEAAVGARSKCDVAVAAPRKVDVLSVAKFVIVGVCGANQ